MSTNRRRPCHWSMPNSHSPFGSTKADNLHALAGGLAQPYEEWLIDQDKTDEPGLEVQYRIRQLGDLGIIRDALEEAAAETVAYARDAGATWEQIGKALGVTRQAAQQRFSEHVQRVVEGSPSCQSRAVK